MRKKASRAELKQVFQRAPLQEGFPLYIDSTINIRDDKINLEGQKGMVLYAHGAARHVISLCELGGDLPAYRLDLSPQAVPGQSGLHLYGEAFDFGLHLLPEGQVGLGNKPPERTLDVDGIVATEAMIGTYAWGEVPADGQWHDTAVQGLTQGCHAYEITAYIGDERDERYALSHGTVMLEIGRRKARTVMDVTRAASKWLWGRRWNHILFRWAVDQREKRSQKRYQLQVRTRTHYDLDENDQPKLLFYRLQQIAL